ncbi:hypothetical protein C8J57DRAFT_1387361 [Mycena rebaudengoi]|nr:hypothetical protein C8J57DRAFT_1387361 [Mycena rebaudengoi]
MSDVIVCWPLYLNNLKVRLLLILCLLGSLSVSQYSSLYCAVACLHRPAAGATTHMTFAALWPFGDEELDPSGLHALIMVLPLLVTNIVATSLMAYKLWQYRQ